MPGRLMEMQAEAAKEATCVSKSDLSAGLVAKPIVKQTHQIMVGRLKSGLIFVQADCVEVCIDPSMVDELIAALLLAKGD